VRWLGTQFSVVVIGRGSRVGAEVRLGVGLGIQVIGLAGVLGRVEVEPGRSVVGNTGRFRGL